MVTDPAQIEVREMKRGDAEVIFDGGEVEAGAVEGDEEADVVEEVEEIVEVFVLDEGVKGAPVEAGDDGDGGVKVVAGGFDIEVGGFVAEVVEDAPVVLGFEGLDEVVKVVLGEGVDGLFEGVEEGIGGKSGKLRGVGGAELKPVEEAPLVEGEEFSGSDAGEVEEGTGGGGVVHSPMRVSPRATVT